MTTGHLADKLIKHCFDHMLLSLSLSFAIIHLFSFSNMSSYVYGRFKNVLTREKPSIHMYNKKNTILIVLKSYIQFTSTCEICQTPITIKHVLHKQKTSTYTFLYKILTRDFILVFLFLLLLHSQHAFGCKRQQHLFSRLFKNCLSLISKKKFPLFVKRNDFDDEK